MTRGDGIWAERWDIRQWPSGWTVHHVEETTSTNTVLADALDRGEVGDRTVLVADHQTAGRGRLDRRWEAPPGANLLVSIAFDGRRVREAGASPVDPMELTRRVGLAVCDAARARRSDVEIGLKWPNDVMLAGRKLAGVLAQRSTSTGHVVVGAGVNLAWSPWDAAQLDDDAIGASCSPADFLVTLLESLDAQPSTFGDEYRAALLTLGQRVRVELPGDRFVTGSAIDLDPDGRLIVDVDGGVPMAVDAGDVVHLRPV